MTWKDVIKNRKPDYPDLDGDGDTEEPMVDALKTVEQVESVKKIGLIPTDARFRGKDKTIYTKDSLDKHRKFFDKVEEWLKHEGENVGRLRPAIEMNLEHAYESLEKENLKHAELYYTALKSLLSTMAPTHRKDW